MSVYIYREKGFLPEQQYTKDVQGDNSIELNDIIYHHLLMGFV